WHIAIGDTSSRAFDLLSHRARRPKIDQRALAFAGSAKHRAIVARALSAQHHAALADRERAFDAIHASPQQHGAPQSLAIGRSTANLIERRQDSRGIVT